MFEPQILNSYFYLASQNRRLLCSKRRFLGKRYRTPLFFPHGTDSSVGGFTIVGQADVESRGSNCYIVTYDVTYTWNDIIDPNPIYAGDRVMSWLLRLFYNPQDFNIHIDWTEEATIKVKDGAVVEKEGYPFD